MSRKTRTNVLLFALGLFRAAFPLALNLSQASTLQLPNVTASERLLVNGRNWPSLISASLSRNVSTLDAQEKLRCNGDEFGRLRHDNCRDTILDAKYIVRGRPGAGQNSETFRDRATGNWEVNLPSRWGNRKAFTYIPVLALQLTVHSSRRLHS